MGKARILIVDDDPDLRSALQVVLESADYTVTSACNRVLGMEKLRSESPDLLILDVMMNTWQDGFEMARELKSDPELSDVPILMLTGVKEKTGIGFKSTAGDSEWLPVDGFMDKPVEPDILIEEVGRLLSNKD
jgi:CheY-like chemotaxis protein